MSTSAADSPTIPAPAVSATDAPASGDLVVALDTERAGCFTVGQVPDPPSIECVSLVAAIDAARAFARVHRVDVWVREGAAPELRHVFRPGGRLPARPRSRS